MRKSFEQKFGYGGFTIIEVLIVLAIAGLIIAVVLIAVPQLQRNQRDSARKNVLSRVKSELESYAGNNRGPYPTADALTSTGFNTGGGFPTRYLSNIDTVDPSTGAAMTLATWTTDTALVRGTISYILGRICAGEASTSTGATARNYVIMTKLESGAVICLSNT